MSLFNGKDLSGWETSLSARRSDVGRDPKGVFSVVEVDGKPAIRISGDGLGGLTTLKEYENYHLELEFKWGEKRFAAAGQRAARQRPVVPRVRPLQPGAPGGWSRSSSASSKAARRATSGASPGTHGERIVVDVEGEDIPTEKRRYPNEPIKYRPGGKKYVGHASSASSTATTTRSRAASGTSST